ncbi:hypothetical protein SLE2022_097790 [Rubroshorea leprosula]
MGDHFVLLVDRLITESTIEAAIESRNRALQATTSAVADTKAVYSFPKVGFEDVSTPRKIVECRICQDEDFDSNMETPCSCCGSLKYAHRSCVQRWCNEKGNTICEICHQQFKPGYTAPPPLFQLPMNFRRNWEISRRGLNNPRFIAMVSTERNFIDPGYDEYSVPTTRSAMCCRTVVLIFMVLLVLRQTIPLILSGTNDYSFPLFMLLLLRTFGVVLPIYVIVRAVTAFQHRRHQQVTPSSSTELDEEAEEATPQPQPQPHVINVDAP